MFNSADHDVPPTGRAMNCAHRPPDRQAHRDSLKLVLWVTGAFMVVELVAGVAANSLALMADAGHMFTDVAAIALALFAVWVARRPAPPDKTFGYLRYEILAALVNGTALLVLAAGIVWDAVRRLGAPPEVNARLLLAVASLGFLVNLFAARVLHRGHTESLNMRGAYLHVLGDLLGSAGAMAAGALILAAGWLAADPIISIGIALLILVGAVRLVRESVDVLLEATPAHVSLGEVERRIDEIPGVEGVHDLHVWTVTSGVVAMSGHAVVCDPGLSQTVLETVQERMAALGIHHVTLQIERDPTCPPAS